MSSEKCKLKQDTTIYLLKWPKSGTLKTWNAGEDVEQQEFSLSAGGNIKHFGHWKTEDDLTVCYKTKHTLTKQSNNHSPQYSSKRY